MGGLERCMTPTFPDWIVFNKSHSCVSKTSQWLQYYYCSVTVTMVTVHGLTSWHLHEKTIQPWFRLLSVKQHKGIVEAKRRHLVYMRDNVVIAHEMAYYKLSHNARPIRFQNKSLWVVVKQNASPWCDIAVYIARQILPSYFGKVEISYVATKGCDLILLSQKNFWQMQKWETLTSHRNTRYLQEALNSIAK